MQLGLEQMRRRAGRIDLMAIERLRRINRGRGGAHHQADPPRAITVTGIGNCQSEFIGVEPGPGQPVIAAVPGRQIRGQIPDLGFQIGDRPIQVVSGVRGEVVGRERPASSL